MATYKKNVFLYKGWQPKGIRVSFSKIEAASLLRLSLNELAEPQATQFVAIYT